MILNWLIYLYYIWFSLFMSASCFDSILLIWRHTSGQITIVPTPDHFEGVVSTTILQWPTGGNGSPTSFHCKTKKPRCGSSPPSNFAEGIWCIFTYPTGERDRHAMFYSKIELSNGHKTLTWHKPWIGSASKIFVVSLWKWVEYRNPCINWRSIVNWSLLSWEWETNPFEARTCWCK